MLLSPGFGVPHPGASWDLVFDDIKRALELGAFEVQLFAENLHRAVGGKDQTNEFLAVGASMASVIDAGLPPLPSSAMTRMPAAVHKRMRSCSGSATRGLLPLGPR